MQIRYNTPVQALELRDGEFVAALAGAERIAAKTCVLAAGGFESNREWLREAWGKMSAASGLPTTFHPRHPF